MRGSTDVVTLDEALATPSLASARPLGDAVPPDLCTPAEWAAWVQQLVHRSGLEPEEIEGVVVVAYHPAFLLRAVAAHAPRLQHALVLNARGGEGLRSLAGALRDLGGLLGGGDLFVADAPVDASADGAAYSPEAYLAVSRFLRARGLRLGRTLVVCDPVARVFSAVHRAAAAAVVDLAHGFSARWLASDAEIAADELVEWAGALERAGHVYHALKLRLRLHASQPAPELATAIARGWAEVQCYEQARQWLARSDVQGPERTRLERRWDGLATSPAYARARTDALRRLARHASAAAERVALLPPSRVAVATLRDIPWKRDRRPDDLYVRRKDYRLVVELQRDGLRELNVPPWEVAASHQAYIVGEVSSANMLLFRVLQAILERGGVLTPEQRLLSRGLSNFQHVGSDHVHASVSAIETRALPQSTVAPYVAYGWTHTAPVAFWDSPVYRATKKVYVHRDGRDVVAAYITSCTLSDAYNRKNYVEPIHAETPAHYGCLEADLKHAVARVLDNPAERWLINALSFEARREDFLEVRFLDVTSDPKGTGRLAETVERMASHVGVAADAQTIARDIQAMEGQAGATTAFRKGYSKVGRYRAFFEAEDLAALEARIGMGLVTLGYMSLEEFCPELASRGAVTALVDDDEDAMLGASLPFFQHVRRGLRVERLAEVGALRPEEHYVLFSRRRHALRDAPNVTYFPYYRPFLEYDPKLFVPGSMERVRLSSLAGRRVIVVGADHAARCFLQPFFENREIPVDFVEALDAEASRRADVVLVGSAHYRRSHELAAALVRDPGVAVRVLSTLPTLYERGAREQVPTAG